MMKSTKNKIDLLYEVIHDKLKSLRLGIFNIEKHKQENALVSWERCELGSTSGMIAAYKKMLDSDKIEADLSIDIINKIREGLFSTCNTKYDSDKKQLYGNIKKIGDSDEDEDELNELSEDQRSFIIPKDATKEQLKALIINSHILALKNEQYKNDDIDILRQSLEEFDKSEKYSADNAKKKLPYTVTIMPQIRTVTGVKDPKDIYYKSIIQAYIKAQEELDSESVAETLTNIVDLVMNLERLHPYLDFNCRTFCVLILNRELIKNDLCPSLMDDPNIFDYQTKDELVIQVIESQKNFINISNFGSANATDALVSDWIKKAKECMEDEFGLENQLKVLLGEELTIEKDMLEKEQEDYKTFTQNIEDDVLQEDDIYSEQVTLLSLFKHQTEDSSIALLAEYDSLFEE